MPRWSFFEQDGWIRGSSEVASILNHYMILRSPLSSPCVVNNHLSLLLFKRHIDIFSHSDIYAKRVFFQSLSLIIFNPSRISFEYPVPPASLSPLVMTISCWKATSFLILQVSQDCLGIPTSQVVHLATWLCAGKFKACLPLFAFLSKILHKHLSCNSKNNLWESFSCFFISAGRERFFKSFQSPLFRAQCPVKSSITSQHYRAYSNLLIHFTFQL